MTCKCGHPIKDHDWNFVIGEVQPCNRCDCTDFKEETNKRKLKRFIKKGIW